MIEKRWYYVGAKYAKSLAVCKPYDSLELGQIFFIDDQDEYYITKQYFKA